MNNTGVTMLSILTPSIPNRLDKLIALNENLKNQIFQISKLETLGCVEWIIDNSTSFLNGGLSIGKKRESLVQRATGKYLCFLDDDDTVSPNYIETLVRLCNQDQDVCTFRSLIKLEKYWGIVNMKLAYLVNDQFSAEHTIRRPPWHICPVRSEFAKLYGFENINNAEDFKWFEKVLSHCTTESHTDRILFQYNHGPDSEADKITNHEKQ